MKNKENRVFRAAFKLLGPLVFYELCAKTASWVCSLFGAQDALFVTGGGALFALPFLYGAYRRQRKRAVCKKQERYKNQRMNTGCFFSALTGACSCLCLNVLLQALIPPSDGWNSAREAVYGASLAAQVLVTVVLAPLAEELLFRGLIRTELRTYMKPRAAAFLGAVLFGLYHGNISQGIYAFLLALCLELVCEWSGSLLPAIFLHAGANAAAIALTALMSGMQMVFEPWTAWSVTAAGLCLTAAALYKTKEVFCKL